MPTYMIQGAYNSEGLSAVVKNPQDRFQAVKPAIEKVGGKLIDAYYSFGDYDFVVIVEMPDNVSAAALLLSFGAGGTVRLTKTTLLLTANEGVQAMKKASGTGYKPATT
jgi:uncharacterized protein with GYD domain